MCKRFVPGLCEISLSTIEELCALNQQTTYSTGADRTGVLNLECRFLTGRDEGSIPNLAVMGTLIAGVCTGIIQAVEQGQRHAFVKHWMFVVRRWVLVTLPPQVATTKMTGIRRLVAVELMTLSPEQFMKEKFPAHCQNMTNYCCPAFVHWYKKHFTNNLVMLILLSISPMVAYLRTYESPECLKPYSFTVLSVHA